MVVIVSVELRLDFGFAEILLVLLKVRVVDVFPPLVDVVFVEVLFIFWHEWCLESLLVQRIPVKVS